MQENSVGVPYGQQPHVPATVQGRGRITESLDCTHPSQITDKVQIPCKGALSVLGCPARSVSLK
jgi:hypothetical protein